MKIFEKFFQGVKGGVGMWYKGDAKTAACQRANCAADTFQEERLTIKNKPRH
jgi:hypothetical protein